MDVTLGVVLFTISFFAALAALSVLAAIQSRRRHKAASLFSDGSAGTVFLFDDETLIDASDGARALLAASRLRGSAWSRFMAYAGPRFPDLQDKLSNLADLGRLVLTAQGANPMTLVAEWRGGLRRIALFDPHAEGQVQTLDTLSHRAQTEELGCLREVTDAMPFPVWRETATGQIDWANHAYVELATRGRDDEDALAWPLPRLFDLRPAEASQRSHLPATDGGRDLWFDCRQVALPAGKVVAALPADATLQAEEALRAFVQTLTKTFAHLPIGLAIFDRQRKLQLFNPALTDLTGLPVDFLSARPAFFAFLDAMRDRQMIPEPKDYKSWRAQMAALEKSAAAGHYEETWSLPSGLTYRIMGRPHPEGALALLFQDISDEITRARRFRADQELGQSVIDAMDEAIAVFSPAGLMVMSNTAYTNLWGHDPGATLCDPGIAQIAAHWRSLSAPATVWGLAESFIITSGPRDPWQGDVRLDDGRALQCRFAPLAGGATLVGFRTDPRVARRTAQPPEKGATKRTASAASS